ncbi:MAG: alpha/beta hydrolase [Candidatus Sumerlaeota bacterium]|nr:alpha/beta hydrolase [Candidatus Sumerlaeota bacterium]
MDRVFVDLSIRRQGRILAVLLGAGLLTAGGLLFAAEREVSPQQLEKMLKRYPDADADKDGTLTMDEARTYFRDLRSGKAPSASKPTSAPASSGPVGEGKGASPSAKGAKRGAESFDMAAYLEQLSAKGRERGYKEFVYKQTPQGELRIYFAMPADWSPSDKRPAVVFFYGGGWSGGNVFSYDEQSEYFAKCGVVAGMADYRVRTRHGVTPDKCVEDARSAVRWIRSNGDKLGLDPNRVIAGGGSAGGHVAACTAIPGAPNSDTDNLRVSCIPNGLMLCFPAVGPVDDSQPSLIEVMLGKEMADKLLPARHVTASWPPTIMFFGTADRLLPGGVLLYNKARESGVMCELYLAAGQGHGFVNIAPWNYVSSRYAADFFIRAGVLDKGPLPETPPGELRKYNGEPVESILIKTNANPSREMLNARGAESKPETSEPDK